MLPGSVNVPVTSSKTYSAAANPGWLQIAGAFIGPYLQNDTSGFYQKYPSSASFPSPPVPPADPSETEDCLFLDVQVPEPIFRKRETAKAPVLVWIYGGGFTGGYKNQYSSATLLGQSYDGPTGGVIFVALNYRVSQSAETYMKLQINEKAGRFWLACWSWCSSKRRPSRSASSSRMGPEVYRTLWWRSKTSHRSRRICWCRVYSVSPYCQWRYAIWPSISAGHTSESLLFPGPWTGSE